MPERSESDEAEKNDSVWATVSGVLRTYTGFTLDYVLHDLSYANLIMLSSVIPSYNSDKKKNKGSKEKISGDDPQNMDKINRELELLG